MLVYEAKTKKEIQPLIEESLKKLKVKGKKTAKVKLLSNRDQCKIQ